MNRVERGGPGQLPTHGNVAGASSSDDRDCKVMQDIGTAMFDEPLRRIDDTDDAVFYRQPRFVYHVEPKGVQAITQLYREWLPARRRVLDLMSSWVSHLPPEVEFGEVVGLGMNPIELNANPRLDIRVVRDLNQAPVLPFDDARFDAATICLGTYYLIYPTRLLTDLARVVVDNAPLIMIYSNRWFPTKAVMPWLNLDDRGRGAFLREILLRTGAWNVAVTLDCTPPAATYSSPLSHVGDRYSHRICAASGDHWNRLLMGKAK
ncbi:MAG: hypothetical protein ACKVQT_06285 [Burkholderiales bacterium]